MNDELNDRVVLVTGRPPGSDAPPRSRFPATGPRLPSVHDDGSVSTRWSTRRRAR